MTRSESSGSGRHVKRKHGLTRTKTGCMTCRKRRKKCDGEQPICGHCDRLRLDCAWPSTTIDDQPRARKSRSKQAPTKESTPSTRSPSIPMFTKDEFTHESLPFTQADLEAARWLESYKAQATPEPQLLTIVDPAVRNNSLVSVESLVEEELFELEDEFVLYPEPLSRSFVLDSPFAALDHDTKILIDYFETEFAPLISAGPRRTNNLLRVFLPMAATNEAVLISIAGWSATHLRDIDEKFRDQSRTHMDRAVSMLTEMLEDPAQRDLDTTLAVALIICAVEVCKDEDTDWARYKDLAYDIIQRRDLIRRYSGHDQAFMLLNYAYHNTVASLIPIEEEHALPGLETQQILRNVPSPGGPDCYLGICAPLYCLISEVSTLRARIYLEDLGPRAIATFASRMIVTLDSQNPHPHDLEILVPEERIQHCAIWRILKLVGKLYIHQVILNYPSTHTSSRALVETIMPLFSSLKKVLAEMLFPLFIVGIDALLETRVKIGRMMEIMFERYRISNVRLAFTVLEKCWAANHDGRVYVDWNELAYRTFGQVVSFA